MQVGDLYRVIARNSHQPSTYHDLVTIIEFSPSGVLCTAYNIRLGKPQHYMTRELEVICK